MEIFVSSYTGLPFVKQLYTDLFEIIAYEVEVQPLHKLPVTGLYS